MPKRKADEPRTPAGWLEKKARRMEDGQEYRAVTEAERKEHAQRIHALRDEKQQKGKR